MPLISAFILIFASCSDKYFISDGPTWGTSYHIVYSATQPLDSEIKDVLELVNNELSMFNPSSRVSRINAGSTDSAGIYFSEVFTLAQEINRISRGVYDPTVGPLTDLWGFGRKQISATPSDSAIAIALSAVGIGDCSITADGLVVKKSPATVFDFSSIAKGYGVDLVGRMLEKNGVVNYMIEIGGEIRVKGVNPQGRLWHIQIDSPESGLDHKQLSIVALGPERTAMASSGNYRNFRKDANGKTYGHTLSPITGYPVEGFIPAATVIAPDCATADALATACMASAHPDSAIAILNRAKVAGLVVDTALTVIKTANFPK